MATAQQRAMEWAALEKEAALSVCAHTHSIRPKSACEDCRSLARTIVRTARALAERDEREKNAAEVAKRDIARAYAIESARRSRS